MTISIDDTKIQKLNSLGVITNEDIEKYINTLLENYLNQFIYLSHGFKYDNLSQTLYDSKGEIIKLTNTEFNLFKLLIDNKNSIVPIETIYEVVWENKKASIHTLRNKIKNLRNKCYYDLIQNHSNIGYRIP
jgi:DNA-binding response OmpR family regulator